MNGPGKARRVGGRSIQTQGPETAKLRGHSGSRHQQIAMTKKNLHLFNIHYKNCTYKCVCD